MTWGVWIGCTEEGVRDLADEVEIILVVTFLAVKGIDLATSKVEDLL